MIEKIFDAVSSEDLTTVRQLLEKDSGLISVRGLNGMTPLHMASVRCQQRVAQMLIEKGADVNTLKDDGWTPLHHSCQNGDVSLVKLLLDNGADLNIRTGGGQTTLHVTAYGLTESSVKTLENDQINAHLIIPLGLNTGRIVLILMKEVRSHRRGPAVGCD